MSSDILYEVKGPKTLFEMTWEEVAEALKKTDIAVIPVGSTEQHGTHLPLGSDSMQGTDLAKRVTAKLAEKGITVVAAPTIPFGVSHHHMKFPGSITLTTETLTAVIWEVCQSLYEHGFRKFVLLLSHGGNMNTLKLAADDLAELLPDTKFIVPDWLPINSAEYPDVLKSDRPTDEHHSGEGETSRMLASTPNLVLMNRAKPYYMDPEIDPYRKKPYRGSVHTAEHDVGMKELTEHGVMGDPRRATAETGETLYEVSVEWLAQVIEHEFLG